MSPVDFKLAPPDCGVTKMMIDVTDKHAVFVLAKCIPFNDILSVAIPEGFISEKLNAKILLAEIIDEIVPLHGEPVHFQTDLMLRIRVHNNPP